MPEELEQHYFLCTMSEQERCSYEYNNLEVETEFEGSLDREVPTDPDNEVFERRLQPWTPHV